MTQSVLQIQSEDEHGVITSVALVPLQGGVVRSYCSYLPGEEWHWFSPSGHNHPACFPMVPFCSRISGGKFSHEEQEVTLTPNNLPEPHAIHGHGFQRAWQVMHHHPDRAVLTYEHQPDAWPWRYRATARYTLEGMQLRVELQVENLSSRAMPVGLGLHPYFPRKNTAELQTQCSHWLELDEELMPIALRATPPGLDMRTGLGLAQHSLDHVFLGWQGAALIRWTGDSETDESGHQLLIRSSCPYLVVWAPPKDDFFCVEGVSNLPDAFNGKVAHLLDGDEGFVRLDPGGVHRCTWEFVPQTSALVEG